MTKRGGGTLAVIEHIYREIPAFTDLFTEDSFYVFATCFTCATIVIAFLLSRCVTIRPVEI